MNDSQLFQCHANILCMVCGCVRDVDGGGSKLWMLEDNEDNQREDCSRKRTNSLFSFLHLRHISCCCCWAGEQCNCNCIVLPLVIFYWLLLALLLVQLNSLYSSTWNHTFMLCITVNPDSNANGWVISLLFHLAWCKHWVWTSPPIYW